ncbi:MAG: LL-diaminopimelate aminotransferase [Nitrospinae bacterium]|nr:LL-diaminopimelate aminotransferase [Nitrospinota bacterium]
MSEPYIQQLFAERIGGKNFGKEDKIYKFEKIKRAKRAALAANPGAEMIDMGVGEPDWMADKLVVDELIAQARRRENRGYTDNGIQAFKDAACAYMDAVYGVKGLDPAKHVNHAIGSKPALAMMPACFINPGDVAFMTVPGYPVMGTHTAYYGGEVVNLPLKRENGFLPDLDAIPADKLAKAKMLYINYPNNPTGAMADAKFFEKVVAFANKHKLVVVQDAAYGALVYGRKPLSFLSIDGAMDVGVEIHSLSKAFNMTGWRMAFVAGNPLVVNAFATVKDNCDSGQFAAIQHAGVKALQNPAITARTVAKYERKLKLMVDALREVGFDAKLPGGTFYLYVPAPKGTKGGVKFATAEDASQFLIKEKLISTVPEDTVGSFLRFGCTFEAKDEADEKRVVALMKQRMLEAGLVF